MKLAFIVEEAKENWYGCLLTRERHVPLWTHQKRFKQAFKQIDMSKTQN